VASELAWMVLGADTAGELATAKAAGATHGLVEVFWDQCQTTTAGAVDATGVQAHIGRVLAADLKVCLRVSLQYIPSFVDTAAVKFRRNGGVDHNPGNVSGNNARDWVWSASTRALVDDFLTKLFNQLTWSQIERVQLGGGPAGELQYPDSDGTQWWGYSSPAQTGTDLAAGQTVCPVPGHVPSTGTTWVANDVSFAAWYTQSLTNWMLWLIGRHRAYFSGPIWVMHPGAGLRRTSQTPTGSQALNYRVNVAKGVDWFAQVAAYPDANVHPYCTWADSPHFFAAGAYSDVNDGDAAPWYHLLRVARAAGRQARIWGENTGGQSNTDMDRVFSAVGAVGHGYQGLTWLSHVTLTAGGGAATYANLTSRIAVAETAFGGGIYGRGVNMAGGEFAASNSTLPGTYGTDYSYDTAAAYAAVAARGHKVIRLPFRWERLQPIRNAALDAAELARIQQVVADVRSAGAQAVLDCHNYGRYIPPGGADLILGSTLPVADLVDLWTRVSVAFQGNPGVYGYGLMNEPHDLAPALGSFSGTTRYDWASGVQGWTGDSATASNVAGQLRLTQALGAGNVQMRKDDAATVSGGTGPTGSVLRVKATPVALPAGTWTAKAQWQNSSFAYQNPTSVTMSRVDTGAVVTSLTVGQPVYVTCVFSSIASPPTAFALQVDGAGATAGTVTVDFDLFAQGTLSGGQSAAQVWEAASQQVVDAVRAAGDTTKILVAGYSWSGAKTWAATHPAPWITGGGDVAYEAHCYYDSDSSGDYPDTYAAETALAAAGGYASLASRAVTEVQNFTTWCTGNGVRGFLGEVGWPNTGDTTGWNTVGEAIYDELDLHGIGATYWSAGARWGTTYNLSVYTGAGQATAQPQATIIEAHLSGMAAAGPGSGGGGGVVGSSSSAGSGLRRNLAPNPACKTNATGWSAVSNTGTTLADWVRSAAVGASLPRTTGFEGTSAGDVLTPRAAVTAGQSYHWSVSVRATGGALSANMLVNYYAALSGGSFVANSGATVPLNLAAGSSARFVVGPYTVPAGAVSGYLKLNDLDAGAEVTAYQVESAGTWDGSYFDGDTVGASWDGSSGNSASTIRRLVETLFIGDGFARAVTPSGPVATEQVRVVESLAIAAASQFIEPVEVRDSFLISALEWDERRGRNRVSAFTFGSSVTSVRVSRRRVQGGVWELVRGGVVDVQAGRMVRPVDDYEFPSGTDLDYRIEGVTSTGVVQQSATVRRRSVADAVWLKFISRPALNRRLEFMGRSDVSRPSRTALYDVQGRPDPVVVSDVHSSRRFSIRVKTETAQDTDALDHALQQGLPCYLQVPAGINCPSIYAVVGDYSFAPPARTSARNVWTIPLTEVSAPPASIVSPGATWAQLLIDYPSWEAVLAAVPTWLDIAD